MIVMISAPMSDSPIPSRGRLLWHGLVATAAASLLCGCDPILSVDGAFFPAWLLCMIASGFLLGGIRWIVSRLGWESFVRPRVLVYFCVYLNCTLGLWLLIFRT